MPDNVQYCAKLLRENADKFIWESPKKSGSPCNPSYFAKLFKEAIGAVEGVRVLTPHSCRHTFISQMQALGVSMETIQSIVGHADVDMTRHYLHVQEPKRQGAIALFDEALNKKVGEPMETYLTMWNYRNSRIIQKMMQPQGLA